MPGPPWNARARERGGKHFAPHFPKKRNSPKDPFYIFIDSFMPNLENQKDKQESIDHFVRPAN
jgi:hypothetical protein